MTELSALLCAASVGAMIFFSAVVAPSVFQTLPASNAGTFLRALFPRYFLINGVVAGMAAILAARALESALLLAAAAAMVGVTYFLIPQINAARDRVTAGDASAKPRFDALHRLSVIINVAEMAVLVGVITLLLRAR
jgi:lipoprotein signal peptidase